MPNANDLAWREALGTLTDTSKLMAQINPNQTKLSFFDQLIRRLIFEGRNTLDSFIVELINSDQFGIGNKDKLRTIRGKIQALTAEEWEREFSLDTDSQKLATSSQKKIPFELPMEDIPTFTGRTEQLDQLKEILLTEEGDKICGIVGLTGCGGVGKSALACHFATIHRDKFPDGVIGVRVDKKDTNTIAREFARKIGRKFDPDEPISPGEIMQQLFASKRILLIFDNATVGDIKELRPGGKLCGVIVTTRNQNLPFSLDVPEKAT
ncbi:MAG: NB-ARC domain-containing protein, partial [Crocosphaera sp.]